MSDCAPFPSYATEMEAVLSINDAVLCHVQAEILK